MALTLIALLLAVFLTACGEAGRSADEASPGDRVTLVLDFLPNAVHSGVYLALERGYYERQGIDLEIVQPSSTADALKLVESGKADLGIAEGIDLADKISSGRHIQGVLALTQRPSGGVITLAREEINSPADLDGKTVGVTGVPSDDAVLDSIISNGGGDPGSVDRVTVGFNGVQSLGSGRLDAFTGFVPVEAAQLETDGYRTRSFPLDEYGGPRYPGLIVFATRDLISRKPGLIQRFVAATVAGYRSTLEKPRAGLQALLDRNPAVSKEFARVSLDAYLPLFQAGAPRYGEFQRDDVSSLIRFLTGNDLIPEPVSAERFATNRFLPGGN